MWVGLIVLGVLVLVGLVVFSPRGAKIEKPDVSYTCSICGEHDCDCDKIKKE
jgi:hypothetical protein